MDDDDAFSWSVVPHAERPKKKPDKVTQQSHAPSPQRADETQQWVAAPVSNSRWVFSSDEESDARRLARENEGLKEVVDRLRREIAALHVELTEARWSVDRAMELGDTLSKVVEENASLKSQLETANGHLVELRDLDEVQKLLLVKLDTKGGFDPTKFQDELKKQLAQLKQLDRLRRLMVPCMQCLLHDEEKAREEIKLMERNASLQMQYSAENLDHAQRYVSAQLAEVESERMWQEDVRAHQLQLAQVQQQLSAMNAVKETVVKKTKEVEFWKSKYRNLKDAGKRHVDELHIIHEDEMKTMRQTYLRCNPNLVFVKWLCHANERIHRNYIEQSVALAYVQRELSYFKSELIFLRRAFSRQLQDMATDVDAALRRCLPIVWNPVSPHKGPKVVTRQQAALVATPAIRVAAEPSTSSTSHPRQRSTSPGARNKVQVKHAHFASIAPSHRQLFSDVPIASTSSTTNHPAGSRVAAAATRASSSTAPHRPPPHQSAVTLLGARAVVRPAETRSREIGGAHHDLGRPTAGSSLLKPVQQFV